MINLRRIVESSEHRETTIELDRIDGGETQQIRGRRTGLIWGWPNG
jgi:hypothetical protein